MKGSKRHIWRRLLGGIGLGIYLLLALLNSSVVQSYLGAAAGSHFSKEWGGKVRIGSIHASLIDHVILEKIELISPTGDTIYRGDRIACRFKKFPYHKSGLTMDRVMLRNGRYHYAEMRRPDGHKGCNLDYIIDYYNTGKPRTHKRKPFIIKVGELRLRGIDYIQDLAGKSPETAVCESDGLRPVDINHMRFYGTSGYFRNVYVNNDSVTCRIVSLSTTEASGLEVIDLSMDAEVSPHCIVASNMDLQTADSRLFMDARLEYDGWKGMHDYLHDVMHDVTLKNGTEIDLRDIAWWAPELWGLEEKIAMQGHIYGTVSNMHADGLIANFGGSSNLFLDADIQGLPKMENSHVDIDIHRLHTNYEDLAAVQLPNGVNLQLPAAIEQMRIIDLDASLHGSLRDCEAYFNVNTLIGDLEGHAQMTYDSQLEDYTYVGDLDSRDLGIRTIVPNEWVSRTGMHLSFQGTGFDPKSMDASVEGRLYNTQFRGHNLNRTTLSADMTNQVLNVDLQLKDTLIDLDASLTADLANQHYNGDIILGNAQLTRLKLLETDTDIALTTHLAADLWGKSLETMTGTVSLKNTRGHIGSRRLKLDNIDITAREEDEYKRISLNSDWLEMRMRGYFQYADLELAARDFCDRYLPTYSNPYRDADSADLTPLYDDSFDIDIVWNDSNKTFAQFAPEAEIAQGTNLHGSYNYGDALKVVLRSDLLAAGGMALHDVGLSSNTLGDSYQCRIKAGSLLSGETPLMENIHLTANLGGSLSTLTLKWDDNANTSYNEGDIEMFLNSSAEDNRLMITRPTFYLMGQRWTLVCPKGILVNKERLKVEELKVYGLGQAVTVKAEIAGKEEDYVMAAFDDFSLNHLSTMIFPDKQLTMEGTLDGTVKAKGFAQQTYIDANLTVDNSSINGQPIGRLDINSNYKTDEAKLYVELLSDLVEEGVHREPLQLHGFVSLKENQGDMAFEVEFDDIRLQTLDPMLAQMSSSIDGVADGHLRMNGTMKSPKINGYMSVRDGSMDLGPTGVTYLFSDTLTIDNNVLTLDNFAIRDVLGNQALVNGTLSVEPDGLIMDLNLDSDRITALDKESGDGDFYGKLLTSVRGTVRGPANKLDITANATALDGSELYVPISNQKEVSENEFIVFVNPARPRSATNTPRTATAVQTTSPGMNLMLNVAVTPGMRLHLPMDFQQLGANVTAVGRGDIKVSMRQGGEPTVLGNYEFTSGSFSLSLVQLITKTFAIEEGSTINIPGDFSETRFDINAVYNLRTTLSSLMGANGISSGSDNYIPVQDVITLSGTIDDPTIKFDIRLPNAEQSVTDQVFSYIDRNNELELLNQSVSLLLFGQFSNNGSGSDAVTEGIDGMGLLASSASAILSNLVKFVDVDLKYQNATASAASQWDVGISKQWNKLYFESTFGYGTNSDLDAAIGNVLVGDVEMGYKFTPYFNFYGFQRTNTSYFTRTELPYKQGFGVKLSKDFDSFSELIPWRKRKSKSFERP